MPITVLNSNRKVDYLCDSVLGFYIFKIDQEYANIKIICGKTTLHK